MKKTAISKTLTIVAGLFAAAIILFSQSLYQQAKITQKKNTEHSKAASETVVIAAPADAVTANSVVNLEDKTTPEPLPTFSTEQKQSLLKVDTRVFVRYFKILFRAIISPNAP